MRLVASAALFLLFMILPLLVRRIRGVLTARQSIVLSVTMLVGMVVTFLGLLGAVVAPTGLGLPNALAAVEICLTAGSKLFQHPLKHWPSILAALLLLAFLGRIVIGVVATAKDARRARPGPGVDAEPLGAGGRVLIVSSAEPLAYTTGILRPRIVISSGLRASLSAAELAAVIAHEQRHASGGHVPLLFLARVVRRAFGSIPPTRIATEQLAMALEISADEMAVRVVGDRLVVLRAIESVAIAQSDSLALGIASDGSMERVRNLAYPGRAIAGGRLGALLVGAVLLATLGAQSMAWATGSGAIAHEVVALRLHQACHLPHA